MLARSGFQPLLATYANSILLLPIALTRLLQRVELAPFDASQYRVTCFDRLVGAILKLEARWVALWNIPVGISLYLVAKKAEVWDSK